MSDFECLPIGTAARLAELEAENKGLRFALSRQGKSTMPEMVALHAEVERLRALLKSTVELAEYWINREERKGMSEGEWRTWHSLGYGSNTMISARAELAKARASDE